MTSEQVKHLCELERKLDAILTLQYRGRVFIDAISSPDDDGGLGHVELCQRLDFMVDDDGDEGWEYFSTKEASSLREPVFLLKDNTEVSLKEAERLAARLDKLEKPNGET